MRYVEGVGAMCIAVMLSACTAGRLQTTGIEKFEAGDFAGAKGSLEKEVAEGQLKAAYALGHMYLEGKGVDRDVVKAEQYLLTAAVAGETRAVSGLVAIYSQERCPVEADLAQSWSSIAQGGARSLTSGDIQMTSVSPATLKKLAQFYMEPCEAAGWDRGRVAVQLERHAAAPRKIYIYVP